MARLLNPIGEVGTPRLTLAPRPRDLNDKVVGILDNLKGESTSLLDSIVNRLSANYRLAGRTTITPVSNEPVEAAEQLSKSCDFVIAGFGCSGRYSVWCIKGAVELEKRRTPTVMVCNDGRRSMCQAEATYMGMPSIPLLSLPVPDGARLSPEEVERAAESLIGEIIFSLTQPAEKVAQEFAKRVAAEELEEGITRPNNAFTLEAIEADSAEEATIRFYERGWTDGLPILMPTREAVRKMLAYTDRDREEVVGLLAPRLGKATVEKIATNAVMAGCVPQYLPVLIAAVEAMAEPEFSLSGLQCTSNPAAPLAIVNGPVAKELVINSRFNAFGQGWRSNSTIGRAIRLILMNIGGGVPGTTDKAIQGQPAKFSFCIAENEDETPWEPLHVERGFPKHVSTVTMAGVQANHNFIVLDRTPQTILAFAADAMAMLGANSMFHKGRWPILALNPQAATILAQDGYSKADVKRYLFEHAAVPISRFPPPSRFRLGQIVEDSSGETMVQATGPMEDIIIIVVGAGGVHNQYLATTGDFIKPITKPICLRDGTPVRSVEDFKKRQTMKVRGTGD